MKIFISHSSKNKDYGNILVEFLRSIGIMDEELVFTSNVAYGIPVGQNIFSWLRAQIIEKPFVIYLLSSEYYTSIACLNEMGAAWVIENEHAMLFTPSFDLKSKEYHDGVIDPREIGFYLNDEERMLSFIQLLSAHFSITKNSVIINQKLKKYLSEINEITNKKNSVHTLINESRVKESTTPQNLKLSETTVAQTLPIKTTSTQPNKIYQDIYAKFLDDISSERLKDEELLLIFYMVDTGRTKIMTGWQEHIETGNIKDWEEIKGLDNVLSLNFNSAVRKLNLRNYFETSAVTSSGNPKEVKLKSPIELHLLDLPSDIIELLQNLVLKHPEKPKSKNSFADDLPF